MEETDKDLRFLSDGIEDLPQYLSSKNLFWPLGQTATPLTIGNLLFSLRRLLSKFKNDPVYRDFEQKIDQIKASNRALFQQKEQEELSSRAREWGNSVEDWQENGAALSSLRIDLRNRAVLELILADLDSATIKTTLLIETIDDKFEKMTEPGGFIWEEGLEQGFPKEPYWYLWRRPPGRTK